MSKFEKMIRLAFHPGTGHEEALTAFWKARKFHIANNGNNPPIFGQPDEPPKIQVVILSGQIRLGPLHLLQLKPVINLVSRTCFDENIKYQITIEDTPQMVMKTVSIIYEGEEEKIDKLQIVITALIDTINESV